MKKNTIILITLSLIFCSVGAAWAKDDEGKKLLQQYVHTLATDNSPSRQRDAFEKLSKFEPKTEEQVDFIFSAIKNDDRKVSFAAQKALANIKDKKNTHNIIEALRNKDERIKVAAIWAAGKLKDRTTIPSLVQCLDENEFIATNASFALAEIGDKSVIPVLLERLSKREGGFGTAIAQFGFPALDAIVENVHKERISDGNIEYKNQRLRKIQAIGFIKDRKAIPVLKSLLKDEDENIRVAAASALSNLGELSIADTIQDDSPSVRLCAIEASRNIKDTSIDRILINTFIKDDRYEVRLLAIDVLAHRKSHEAVPYLKESLTNNNKKIRIAAEDAINKITNEE